MGQYHQLFIIAQIDGRYRSLAAIEHGWLYGHTALRRCLDILKMLNDPTNRTPIQQELVAASKHDASFWIPSHEDFREDPKNSHIPFPFLSTCLVIGTSFNVDGYYQEVYLEPFFMPYDGEKNDNGITVFDITNLDDVRYCFVDFRGMESERPVDLMTPLSARDYLEAYYVIDEVEEEVGLKPLLAGFEGKHLVKAAALKETWPEGDWVDHRDDDGNNPGVMSVAILNEQMVNWTVKGDTVKSLRETTLDRVVDQILQQPDNHADLIASASDMFPDLMGKLRLRLSQESSTLSFTPGVIDLLFIALQQESEVDLTPFHLNSKDHLTLLTRLRRRGRMRSLNLSNMPDLGEEALLSILAALDAEYDKEILSPQSHRVNDLPNHGFVVVMLETPKISVEFLMKYMGHYEIYHSDLFRRAFIHDDQNSTPRRALEDDNDLATNMQFSGSNLVTQIVLVGISSEQSITNRSVNGEMDWTSLKYYPLTFSAPDGGKSLLYKNDLLDIPTPAGKVVHGLQRLLEFLWQSTQKLYMREWTKGAIRCFATTSPVVETANGTFEETRYGVGPLCQILYGDPHRMGEYDMSGQGRRLEDGQWAIILVHEALDLYNKKRTNKWMEKLKGQSNTKAAKQLRYAFVKAMPGGGFKVTDVGGYVAEVLGGEEGKLAKGLIKWWNEHSKALPDNYQKFYDEGDMQDILKKVYPSVGG